MLKKFKKKSNQITLKNRNKRINSRNWWHKKQTCNRASKSKMDSLKRLTKLANLRKVKIKEKRQPISGMKNKTFDYI